MPAMIVHYLLGRRMLPLSGLPAIRRQDAFLLGNQGPDLLYFFRAYPWQHGKAGLPLGNALHDVRPSTLVDTLRELLDDTPPQERDIVHSYILGFLCHYAADRLIHPFVCHFQEDLMTLEPTYAKSSEPYHYRIESALDTLLLHIDSGEYVSAFPLTTVLPKKDTARDAVLARFYHRLLDKTLGENVPEQQLCHLTEDMRQSMRLMTDSTELKGKTLRFFERVTKKGAGLSSLLRTKEMGGYDYENREHRMWLKDDAVVSKQDIYELCEEAAALAADLLVGFENGKSGLTLTGDIDFAGHRWFQEGDANETDREL